MNQSEIEAVAQEFETAHARGEYFPREWFDRLSLDDAYRILLALTHRGASVWRDDAPKSRRMPSLAVNVSKKIGAQSEDGAPEHHNAHPGKVLPLRLARGLVLPQAVHVIVVDGVGQRSDERLPARGQKLGMRRARIIGHA
jgi:hypothetical protein